MFRILFGLLPQMPGPFLEYSQPSVSAGDLFQLRLQMVKSVDVQVPDQPSVFVYSASHSENLVTFFTFRSA